MRRFLILLSLLAALSALVGTAAHAETLSWSAPTTYTDGSPLGTATITYEAIWSTSSSLAAPNPLTSSGTSAPFSVTSAGMPRGSTIYFSIRAIVGGVASAWATPLAWNVPALAPSPPGNLRVQ